MAPSSTLVSSPARRHHLSPVIKGPLFGNSIHGNSARHPTPTKRPLFNDENADPNLFKKRVKSVLSPSKPISSVDEILKPSSIPTITTNQSSKSRFILTDKPLVNSQPKRALSNITNTHQRVSKPSHRSAKPLVGSSLKKAYIPSPTRRTRAVSPQIGSGRGQLKRARSSTPPVVFRDVPTSSSNDAPAAPLMPQQQPIPDSWIFDIYEDTVEETLQNLVEFSTHTLDISDNEETSGELDLGKENIPPSRLAEILSTPRENRMSVDAPVKCIPQRQTPAIGPGGRAPRVRREPLREMKEEELVQPGKKTAQDEDMIKKVMNGKEEMQSDKITTTITMTKLPTLSNDSFITFSTPKKIKRKPLLRTTPSPGWKIWESDHDDDANDDNENLPPLPPATKGELEMPLLAGTRRKRALGE